MENPKEILRKIKSFVSEDDYLLLESRVPAVLFKELIGS